MSELSFYNFVERHAGGFALLRITMVLLLCLILSACSNTGIGDLQQFIVEVKSTKKGNIEPLPEFKPFANYVYREQSNKDPFVVWDTSADPSEKIGRISSGIRPEFSRQKEVLENFPLDSLKMLGTLDFSQIKWALVKAPDNIIYRIKSGHHMGKNHGKVTEVREGKLIVVEIIPDGIGGWEERNASLFINEE